MPQPKSPPLLGWYLGNMNVWHDRLCHNNNKYMKNMSCLGLIPKLENEFEKCEICSGTKINRKS